MRLHQLQRLKFRSQRQEFHHGCRIQTSAQKTVKRGVRKKTRWQNRATVSDVEETTSKWSKCEQRYQNFASKFSGHWIYITGLYPIMSENQLFFDQSWQLCCCLLYRCGLEEDFVFSHSDSGMQSPACSVFRSVFGLMIWKTIVFIVALLSLSFYLQEPDFFSGFYFMN